MNDQMLRDLAEDGLEYIGSVEPGSVVVIGDPALIGRTPADGAYHAAPIRPGTWLLFVRADPSDPDVLSEMTAICAAELPAFWDHYDDAVPATQISAPTGRIAWLDATLKDDVALRAAMLEPDDLPWVLDRGCVIGAPRASSPASPARIFQSEPGPCVLMTIALDPPSRQIMSVPFSD